MDEQVPDVVEPEPFHLPHAVAMEAWDGARAAAERFKNIEQNLMAMQEAQMAYDDHRRFCRRWKVW